MKLIHTADWHLGKNIEGHSRLEEQRLFLKDFINICEEEQADIIIIAGDIYDNYNPSAMAEQLLRYFKTIIKKWRLYDRCHCR